MFFLYIFKWKNFFFLSFWQYSSNDITISQGKPKQSEEHSHSLLTTSTHLAAYGLHIYNTGSIHALIQCQFLLCTITDLPLKDASLAIILLLCCTGLFSSLLNFSWQHTHTLSLLRLKQSKKASLYLTFQGSYCPIFGIFLQYLLPGCSMTWSTNSTPPIPSYP
jgi:hypothetical protein